MFWMKMFYSFLSVILLFHYSCGEVSQKTFPDGFQFGVATAAYQIEGAWNEDGKSENIWDYATHVNPKYIADESNGDVAADSYHKYKEDIELIKNLGANFYRISISWTRLIPDAVEGSKLNEKGVAYYNNLIDELIANGIEPYVTIFHWDTPQSLEIHGGWLNETIIDNYIYYARQVFNLYGDRVKKWFTFNEPKQICDQGYETAEKAPFMRLHGVGLYQCYHNVVRAHGKIYRIYEKEFKPTQKGEIGITADCMFPEPKTDSISDKEAAETYIEFNYGWYLNPIILGNYPPIMIEKVDKHSKEEGRTTSRLPKFTEEEIEMIKGTFDFLGVNHYTTVLATFGDPESFENPSQKRDCGVEISRDPSWKPSVASWLYEVPTGFYHLLMWIKEHYNNPRVIISENGWASDSPDIDDVDRVQYTTNYLSALLQAIDDGCNVVGYTHWSLIDNFEWAFGYTNRFGLVYVDFNDPNRTRIPRTSYRFYQKVISSRRLTSN
ncbi:hypothetical protein WA026_015745 [Henosepilachna vigintioctopunctata]|uniref:Beta-glucosidase n=1 Tax=Henosepilachna vigintioctopunctata TaxID=420089 RepID=A0AAW1URQ9_9CUCU